MAIRKKPVKATTKAGTPAKKRISGKAAKAKGVRGETEIVEALIHLGVPSMRVLGSGAMAGAQSDVKVGIRMNEDGSFPEKDESQGVLRAEVKNRQDNPDFHTHCKESSPIALLGIETGQEILWRHANQDSCTRAVLLKRNKTPVGAISGKDYNQAYGVFMGLTDFAWLVKKAFPEREFYFYPEDAPKNE